MPTPEQNKEAMKALHELGKTVDAMTPEERANRPSIDELQDSKVSPSAFRMEDIQDSGQPKREMPFGVSVESGASQDGLEGASLKDLVRELIQVTRNLPNEIDSMLRQD